MGQAFALVRECLDRLISLYPPLLAALEAAFPERRLLDHETVVAARDPRGSQGIQPASRENDPPTEEAPRRTGGFMWRK